MKTLAVTKREKQASAVRAEGGVPAVVYGPKQEPISISVQRSDLEKLMREAGESTIISLTGLDAEVEVLIHEAAFNAERGGIDHIDFYAIERGKELTTNVPLEFVGEAPVEKEGATVNRILHDIEVTTRPSKLPGEIVVDVSVLATEEDQILVKDLVIPEGVTVNTDMDAVVAGVSAAREEEPEEEVEAPDMDAIEVEAKGKQDDGEAEAPAAEEKSE